MITNLLEIQTDITEEFNNSVIDVIKKQRSWHMSPDETDQDKTVADGYCDTGMLLSSYSYKQSEYLNLHNQNVNELALTIFNNVINAQKTYKFHNIIIKRFLWNYYNRSSTGVFHKDISEKYPDNYGSVVYYLNSCDAKTIVNDIEVQNKASNAILFNPKTIHCGTGPTKDKYKYALNVLFEFEKCTVNTKEG